MMIYYKHDAESVLGEGTVYLAVESEEDIVLQQVEIYSGKAFWSDAESQSDERFMLADQPVSSIGLGEEHQIERAEFEQVWAKAVSECR